MLINYNNRCNLHGVNIRFKKMSENQKRISISVDPEMHDLIKRLAKYQGTNMTAFINDILQETRPVLEAMDKAFEQAFKGRDKADILQDLMVAGLESAVQSLKKQ